MKSAVGKAVADKRAKLEELRMLKKELTGLVRVAKENAREAGKAARTATSELNKLVRKQKANNERIAKLRG